MRSDNKRSGKEYYHMISDTVRKKWSVNVKWNVVRNSKDFEADPLFLENMEIYLLESRYDSFKQFIVSSFDLILSVEGIDYWMDVLYIYDPENADKRVIVNKIKFNLENS